jgi:hypothetical protein
MAARMSATVVRLFASESACRVMFHLHRPEHSAFRRPCHGFHQLNKDEILLSEFLQDTS